MTDGFGRDLNGIVAQCVYAMKIESPQSSCLLQCLDEDGDWIELV